ncbi:MAG: Tll0287-like domain-containing protein [Limnospira sp.]
MLKPLYRWMFGLFVAVFLLGSLPAPAHAAVDPGELAKAVQEIENLDGLRSGLASTLEGRTEPITGQTFKEVCKPVGMQAKKLSQENGWKVKQIANKYRNPAHEPDNLHSKMALAKFEQNPELMGFWEPETLDGQPGVRYYRRIDVEASCLGCHGAKESRPEFVKNKYPQDLAFDFKEGDLRGMYAVFIPKLKAALGDS